MTIRSSDFFKVVSQCVILIFLSAFFLLSSCNNSSDSSSDKGKKMEGHKYDNGTYCADVTYYNPNTSTERTYKLNVEVENGGLSKIYWTNGGWLDDSHFTSPDIDDEGKSSFTSDKGYQYSIQITGAECSFSNNNIALEGNDEPREFTLTIQQCASTMNMTEKELLEYEVEFNVSRDDVISEKMCKHMFEYMQKYKELTKRMDALDELMDNGYIQQKFAVGEEDDIECQTIIVKRRGYYYLMEVFGRRSATMGLMDFDPALTEWQDAKILEDPNRPIWKVFTIRIIDKSPEMTRLSNEMKTYCSN